MATASPPATAQATFPLALYLEFHKDDAVYQDIFTQEAVHPGTGKVVDFCMLSRQISPENPKRVWKHRRSPSTTTVTGKGKDARITPGTFADALDTAALNVNGLEVFLRAMIMGGWKMEGSPVVFEVAPDDLHDLSEGKAPRALLSRMKRARTDAGFPPLFGEVDGDDD